MNILIYSKHSVYTSDRVGGAETSFRLLGEKLADRGHNVFYLTSSGDRKSRKLVTAVSSGVSVIFYPSFENLFIQRVKKRLLGKKTRARWLNDSMRRVIVENKIDLVYLHYDIDALDALLSTRDELGFKIVMRMAGLKWYEQGKQDEQKRLAYEGAFNSVDSINYNTPSLRDVCYRHAQSIGLELEPRDEFVADIGAKVGLETSKIEECPHKEMLRIVVATRFSRYQKRQDILIEALRLLPDEISLDVLMIGTGPERENISKKIEDYGLSNGVRISPFLPQTRLWEELKDSDLLCHPCEYEGLSKIIIESMMLGLPVLASNVPPLPDYIEDNNTGFLTANTAEAWAEKLTYIYNNQGKLYAISKAAQEFSLDLYDIDKNVGSYEKNFLRLCKGG